MTYRRQIPRDKPPVSGQKSAQSPDCLPGMAIPSLPTEGWSTACRQRSNREVLFAYCSTWVLYVHCFGGHRFIQQVVFTWEMSLSANPFLLLGNNCVLILAVR